jgi:hypothetical protein
MGRVFRGAVLAVLLGGLPAPAAAQDEGLDPLLFVPLGDSRVEDLNARTFQIYRIPLSYTVRRIEEHPWGFRVTFPVSLSSSRIEVFTDIDDFVTNLEAASIIPGVEFVVPVRDRWQIKPFAEAGVGRAGSGSGTEVLYGAGVRARGDYRAGRVALMLGAAAAYKRPSTSRSEYDAYSRLEIGADAQLPLGFSVGGRAASGGLYGIVRGFSDLELATLGDDPIVLRDQYEVGVSFSTDPGLEVWKIKLPWLALGYQFGDVFTGVRVYFAFPF